MYTRIDIIGGKECRVEFETLREAVREPPRSEAARIRAAALARAAGARQVALAERGRWRGVSCIGGERAVIQSAPSPIERLRARLAEALGLTDPSDDELVEAVSRAASRELTTEMAKHINSNPPPPHLSGAPLPEGREGESIVVVDVGHAVLLRWAKLYGAWCWVADGDDEWHLHPDETNYRWAYVTRAE